MVIRAFDNVAHEDPKLHGLSTHWMGSPSGHLIRIESRYLFVVIVCLVDY